MAAEGEADGYQIKDETKLRALAAGIRHRHRAARTRRRSPRRWPRSRFSEFGQQHGELRLPEARPGEAAEDLAEHGVVPRGVDREVVELMHATHMGVDNDYKEHPPHRDRRRPWPTAGAAR